MTYNPNINPLGHQSFKKSHFRNYSQFKTPEKE